MTGSPRLRIGMAGCGTARRLYVYRLLALAKVEFAGCVNPDRRCAESLAERIGPTSTREKPPVVSGHHTLGPDVPFIFTPHFGHYRPAINAFQASCHVFIEKPLATNFQEAADIVVTGNFVSAIARGTPLFCPDDETLATGGRVNAMTQRRETGQLVHLE